ncbi:MAG: HAD-IA family hydrolase [Acidobacteriota bacterium]
MIGLVVFDLDGTLVDSSIDIANAANALVEELGGTRLSHDAIIRMVGEGAGVLVRRALAAASLDPDTPDTLDRFLAIYNPRLLEHTRPYEGMVDVLTWLAARMPTAVLTNKPAQATTLMLDGLGLRRYFGAVIGGDTSWGRKPDPAGLLHLAETAGVTPERTLMVGDSPVDLATARRAGTRICLARYGFGYRFTPADFRGDELVVDVPAGIIEAIEAMPS